MTLLASFLYYMDIFIIIFIKNLFNHVLLHATCIFFFGNNSDEIIYMYIKESLEFC